MASSEAYSQSHGIIRRWKEKKVLENSQLQSAAENKKAISTGKQSPPVTYLYLEQVRLGVVLHFHLHLGRKALGNLKFHSIVYEKSPY